MDIATLSYAITFFNSFQMVKQVLTIKQTILGFLSVKGEKKNRIVHLTKHTMYLVDGDVC